MYMYHPRHPHLPKSVILERLNLAGIRLIDTFGNLFWN
jgi:hypothetical protein